MDYRKIIEFGKSSFVVSLPKDWMVKNKLSKGDSLQVSRRDDDKLVFFPVDHENAKTDMRKITLDATDMKKEEMKLSLISLYIRNYNEITITAKNMQSKAKDIREMVHELMALEVVEEDAEKIVAKDYLNMDEIDPMDLIRKMDKITKEMISDSKNFFKEDKYLNIKERDLDVNRLSYLLFRTMKYIQRNPFAARGRGTSHQLYIGMWVAAIKIEKIADQAKWITKLLRLVKLSRQEQEDFHTLYSKIETYYNEAIKAFYEKDAETALKLVVKRRNIIKQCRDFNRQITSCEYVPVLIEKMKNLVGETKAIITYVCDLE